MLERLIKPHADSIAVRMGRGGEVSGASWFPLLNLIWMFWMLAAPWMAVKPTLYTVGLTYLSVVIFLVLYMRAWYGDRRRVVWNTAAITVLGLAIIPVNNSWSYIIYASVLIMFCTTTWRALGWLAVVLLAFGAVALNFGYPPLVAVGCMVSCAAIALINLFFRRNGERDAALRLSHDEVRRLAAMAERERIGRDLHDLLGHTLSLIAIKSELADKLFERDPAASRSELRELNKVARESLAQVRAAVTGIRAVGLAAELAAAKLLLESSGVSLHTNLDELPALPAALETGLALCLREAITNVHRHAGARSVSVVIGRRERGLVELLISDDGCGGVAHDGNGLAGMRERVAVLGGSLQLESPRAKGTVITIRARVPETITAITATANVSEASPLPPAAPRAACGWHAMNSSDRLQKDVGAIRVLLAEDQAMVRGALSALLNLEPDIDVLCACADGESAWREVQERRPDVLVSDIEMPGLSGLELAARIRERALPCKVVIVTTFARSGYLRRALDAGVAGYLLKDAPAEQLADALRKVQRGGRVIDPQLALEAWTEQDPLNDRERRVLRLAGEGVASPEIAAQLHLSHGTVRNYLSEAIGKLGAANRIEAYRLARQKGWL